jgi:hypothetical protein
MCVLCLSVNPLFSIIYYYRDLKKVVREAKAKKTLAFEVILHHHHIREAMVVMDMVVLLNLSAFLSLVLNSSSP